MAKVKQEAKQERERMMVEMMLRMASWVAFQLARAPLVSKINPKLVKWLQTHSVCTWLLLSTTTWLRINFFLGGFVQTFHLTTSITPKL